MAKINRTIQPLIQKYLFKNKIIIIYGARQVGKTTLVKIILDHFAGQYFNCDLLQTRNALAQQDPIILKRIFGDAKLIVIDEAQRISNIGLTLKITHEYFPQIQIIATGSSSFDLANKINEPLTGRALEFKLYPFSLQELKQSYSFLELEKQMQSMLIFGSYPEIVTASEDDTILFLDNLASKYLYKDILEFESLKKPDLLVKLLQLLALQIGSECSKHELAISLQVNRLTIERYLDLLEKAFVIFRLKPLSRNLRKEITKKEKIYFFDLGIRNSLISRYNPIEFREDIGALWENFCIVERLKMLEYSGQRVNKYFWRTHSQKEVDYIEEYNNEFHGYEFKWNPKSKYKTPTEFIENYSTVKVINNQSIWDFVALP